MMKARSRWVVWVVVVMLAAAALACGSNLTGSSDTGLGRGAQIQVNNTGTVDICYVYISLPTDDSWGEDKLGAIEVISTGDSRSFDVSPGSYDVRAESCGTGSIDNFGLSVDGTTSWDVSLTD